MKNLRLSLLPALLALSLSTTVMADPTKCPDIKLIQNSEFTVVFKTPGGNTYSSYQYFNLFNTKEEWAFGINGIKANSFDDAVKKAKESTLTLSLKEGPIPQPKHIWECVYTTDAGYEAVALTYTPDNRTKLFTLMELKS